MEQVSGFETELQRCQTECIHPEHVRPLIGRILPAAAAASVVELFQTLADGTRLRILHALSVADELCVCDLAWVLGLSVSAASHQLRVLRDRGTVARRKQGRIVYYRLEDDHVRHVLEEALDHANEQPRPRAAAAQGPAA